jgi:hypothetical protein
MLTHGTYVVSVCGWKVVIVAERASGSAARLSIARPTWSRSVPS